MEAIAPPREAVEMIVDKIACHPQTRKVLAIYEEYRLWSFTVLGCIKDCIMEFRDERSSFSTPRILPIPSK
jgi:hypothetical protein